MSAEIWYMDSDFCEECGCFLSYGESGLCPDCLEEYLDADDEYWMEEDMYDENQAWAAYQQIKPQIDGVSRMLAEGDSQ